MDSVSSSFSSGEGSLRNRLLNNSEQLQQQARPRPESESSYDSDQFEGDLAARVMAEQEEAFRWRDLINPKKYILFLWTTFHRATFASICIAIILWASIFMYISFYYIYVPALDASHAIHFQFDSVCKETCSAPFADIQLHHYKSPAFFAKGQSYKVRVDLDLPESDINWDQGMFMVKLALLDAQKRKITSSARPAILRFKSPVLRYLTIACYWPLLVTGLKQETQHLEVVLLEDYTDHVLPRLGSATSAQIELGGKFYSLPANKTVSNNSGTLPLIARSIQLYTSTLIIQANLTGLRQVDGWK